MAKKKVKATCIKPWYSQYNQLQLHDLITGVIPKRVRNIIAAEERLNWGSSAGAAAFDRDHIRKNLADIEDAFSRIETALVKGEDIPRWKQFPGLDGAVRQVRGVVKLLGAQVKQIPGGSFKFNPPSFFDDRSLGNMTVVRPSPFATGANGEPLQKRTKDEVEVRVKVEGEDEIEEGEIVTKHEDEDGPGMPVDVGGPERLQSPEAEEVNHNLWSEPHQFGHQYTTGFDGYPTRPPAHWMPQSNYFQPSYNPDYWHGVPNNYWHTPHPVVYSQAVMPHYSPGYVGFAPAGMIGQAYPQPPYGSFHPYPPFRAMPQHFEPAAFLPAPPPPPPEVGPSSPIQPPEPSPAPSAEEAPPWSPLATQLLEDERARKRKLSDSPGPSLANSRPLKRLSTAQAGTLLDVDENHHDHTKFPRATSGPPDFGTWFQEQIADSKKKLSQLERALKSTASDQGA